MISQIQTLHDVWLHNRTVQTGDAPQLSFENLNNSIISTGPFYFYIIDFYDMSLSHISPSIADIQGYLPESVTLNDILDGIHPSDLEFVTRAELFLTKFFSEKVEREKLLTYKISYCYRARAKDGEYVLFNHQALMLTMDENGGYGKSLNIHTRIDHISNFNTYKISLIGLHGEPSFMNLSLEEQEKAPLRKFSKREIDIIRLLAVGLGNAAIGERLFISPLTVKKHRTNILVKSESKNTAELIQKCILQGII
jgi:DNA-binding CsgD family transcriptional regulator